MADRIEVPKLVGYVITGKEDVVAVSKLVAYLVLEPGESADAPSGQGHVHTQIIVRAR